MEIKATWKINLFGDADATIVANEIASIGDEVTPSQIVDFAKDENSELHKCFTWSNSEAADKWRIYEARQVVCQLKIVKIDDKGKEQPTPIRVFYKTETGEGYKPTQLIIKNADEYTKMLNRAKSELQTFKAKYKHISELETIFDEIDKL